MQSKEHFTVLKDEHSATFWGLGVIVEVRVIASEDPFEEDPLPLQTSRFVEVILDFLRMVGGFLAIFFAGRLALRFFRIFVLDPVWVILSIGLAGLFLIIIAMISNQLFRNSVLRTKVARNLWYEFLIVLAVILAMIK